MRSWVVDIWMNKLPDGRAEELPEISEGGAACEDIVIMEFLTRFPCEREVHPQSLTFGRRMTAGQTTPIQIGAGSRKRSNHGPRWNYESAPSDPFHLVPRQTTSGRTEQGSARSTGKTCVRDGGGATYLLVSTGHMPGIWRHQYSAISGLGWFPPSRPGVVWSKSATQSCHTMLEPSRSAEAMNWGRHRA